jgi:diaminopimelate epimerase
VRFAADLGLIQGQTRFLAVDGPHEAKLADHGWVELQMIPVDAVESGADYAVLNTGSPHYVVWVEDLKDIDVVENGKAIRYNNRFKKEGINVNFVQATAAQLEVATYERGVEDETWSCGTGVCAAAVASAAATGMLGNVVYNIRTKGGDLQVRVNALGQGRYEDIWLCGPAVRVFEGAISLPSPA